MLFPLATEPVFILWNCGVCYFFPSVHFPKHSNHLSSYATEENQALNITFTLQAATKLPGILPAFTPHQPISAHHPDLLPHHPLPTLNTPGSHTQRRLLHWEASWAWKPWGLGDPHTTFSTEEITLTLSFTNSLRVTHTTPERNDTLHLQNQDRILAATAFLSL